jgi:alkanesulfonate monooxygenase SsuD/methylene tetrahydromethanopterin reductase-like flavin-dependent oxidoreductase (luciferase family)
MEIGVDSFAAILPDPATGRIPAASERMAILLGEIEVADQVGINVFGIGEHHRAEFLDSAPAVILAAAATRTTQIRLTSAVTVLSAADPVRVFQEFATLDLIAKGRAELIVGRGSFGEAFPLFGLDTRAYDDLFAEKLDLFLTLRENTHVTWNGRETVGAKVLHAAEALGGISRITFQMSTASRETAAMKRSIELLGTEVAPIVRAARARVS